MHLTDVLVVEDNEDLRELFAEALRAGGFAADAVGGPTEALHYFRSSVPRVLLLDLVMPYSGEVDFGSTLRGDPRFSDMAIIVVSGSVNLRARAAELGAVAYVSKPVDSDRLLEIVGRHCHRPGDSPAPR